MIIQIQIVSISPGRSESLLNYAQGDGYKNEQSPFTTGSVTNASGRLLLQALLKFALIL